VDSGSSRREIAEALRGCKDEIVSAQLAVERIVDYLVMVRKNGR
jgi:hypothetical protein